MIEHTTLSKALIELCDEKITEFKTTPRKKNTPYNVGFIEALKMVKEFVQKVSE